MRHFLRTLPFLALPLLPACGERGDITVREEPHEAAAPAPAPAQAPAMPKTQVHVGQVLWAGGIKSRDGRWLIFKTIGPAAAVEKTRAALEALAKNQVDDLPEGWTKDEAASQFGRIATLRSPAPELLEVSVSLVGGDMAGNINRWRGQAGLPPLPAAETEAQIKTLDKASGAWAFEVAGTVKDEAPASREEQSPAAGKSALGFTLPAGWKKVQPSSDMRLAQFDAGGCEVAITRFPGTIGRELGSSLDNLNRWRGQVGLPALAQLPQKLEAVGMTIGGHPALVVQVAAAEGEPPVEKAALVAFVADEKGTFFVKLTGQADKVEAQLTPMLDFLKSLTLPFEGPAAALPSDLHPLSTIDKKKPDHK